MVEAPSDERPTRATLFTVVATGLIAGAAGAVVGVATAAGAEMGNVAEWLSGLATTGALLFTARLLQSQQALQRLAEDERREEMRASTRSQAAQVAAWPLGYCKGGAPDEWGNHIDNGVEVQVQNGSDEPVYDLRVRVWTNWLLEQQGSFLPLDVIGPGESTREWIHVDVERDLLGLPPVEIAFTDASGLHWRRTPKGALEQLPESLGGHC